MTPKEKALLLVNKYENVTIEGTEGCFNILKTDAKIFALIAVDVILNDVGAKDWGGDIACDGKNYWTEVKKEIEQL